jgi:autophagy-related protein 17
LSPSSDSLQHSKSQNYATHPEKQDYHAHHLALLLTSLAQHYDQTSSALKEHESPLGQIPDIDKETLEILSHDASEVSEVLEEMEEHVREIEYSSDILQTHAQQISDTYIAITHIFIQIEQYGKVRLLTHLASVRDFDSRAQDHRIHIQTLKQEMFNLVDYYTNFSSAYAALVIEVQRRAENQSHTVVLVNSFAAKFASLYDQEVKARQGFMDLHAAYLPEDLWRGITDPPNRYVVHTEEGGVLPVLRDTGGGGKRLSSAGMEKRRSALGSMGGSGESAGRRSVESSGRRSGESSQRR